MPKIVVQSCIICMRYFSKHSGMAPRCSSPGSKGFTLVELIVVITIMVAMMALAASMSVSYTHLTLPTILLV